MENVEQTIISQYQNAPTLIRLVQNMNQYIDPATDFQSFYNYLWNVDTAQGFGLDVWGRIVDIKRELQVTTQSTYFGFEDGINTGKSNFGSAPFYNGDSASRTYTLSDDAYRTLIYAKALSNITATTSPAINQLLNNLFSNRGRCYVNDMGGMRLRYTFEFVLTPFEESVVNTINILPHGAGVNVGVYIVLPPMFGFDGLGGPDRVANFGDYSLSEHTLGLSCFMQTITTLTALASVAVSTDVTPPTVPTGLTITIDGLSVSPRLSCVMQSITTMTAAVTVISSTDVTPPTTPSGLTATVSNTQSYQRFLLLY